MADRESAERAVKEANPIIDGRKANVNLAYLGAKPRNNAQNGKNEVQKYKNTKIQKHKNEKISLMNMMIVLFTVK